MDELLIVAAFLQEYAERRSFRSAIVGRSLTCWRQRGTGSGSQQLEVPLSPAGPDAYRSAGPGPIQPECAPAKSLVRTRRRSPTNQPSLDRPAWSGPAPRSATRSPLRDAPVPGVSPADPLPTGPSGPAAKPALHRSHDDGPPPAVSHELLALPRRSQ